VESEDISIHLTVGIETETVGLTIYNLLLCILGINDGTKIKEEKLNELTSIIKDIVRHNDFDHFRRSVPFGFNYHDPQQIMNRVRNLTNSLYEMKRQFGGNSTEKGSSSKLNSKAMEPSKSLVDRAYAVFSDLNNDLIRLYGTKLSVVDGDNWNEQQNELQQMLIDKVTRSFKKCKIEVENTNLLFGIKMG